MEYRMQITQHLYQRTDMLETSKVCMHDSDIINDAKCNECNYSLDPKTAGSKRTLAVVSRLTDASLLLRLFALLLRDRLADALPFQL